MCPHDSVDAITRVLDFRSDRLLDVETMMFAIEENE